MIRQRFIKVSLSFILLLPGVFVVLSHSATERTGEYIILETENEQPFKAYVSGRHDAHRGILIIQEWWGLNKDVEAWADEFAKAGYRAIAVDLYNGKVATNPKEAKRYMNAVKQTEANRKYTTALRALRAPSRKLAIIGWSYGGSQALHAALVAPELVSATVIYYPYGAMVTDKSMLTALKSPILGHFADKDFAFTPDKVQQFKNAVKDAAKRLDVHMYDAQHGFDKPAGKFFNKQAHERARRSTHQFLDEHLK